MQVGENYVIELQNQYHAAKSFVDSIVKSGDVHPGLIAFLDDADDPLTAKIHLGVDASKLQMEIDMAEKTDYSATRVFSVDGLDSVPCEPNGMFAPADSPKSSVIACGRGFIGKRIYRESMQYFDMGGKWLDSFGGIAETICTRPFATRVAAEKAIESTVTIGPEEAKKLEAALNEVFRAAGRGAVIVSEPPFTSARYIIPRFEADPAQIELLEQIQRQQVVVQFESPPFSGTPIAKAVTHVAFRKGSGSVRLTAHAWHRKLALEFPTTRQVNDEETEARCQRIGSSDGRNDFGW